MTTAERRKLYTEINKTKDYSLDDFEMMCGTCKQIKHCTEFSKRRRDKNGYNYQCKTCENTLSPKKAQKRKEYEAKRSKDPARKEYEKKRRANPAIKEARNKRNRSISTKAKQKERLEKNPQERYKINLRANINNAFKLYSKNGKTQSRNEYGIDYNVIFEHVGPKPRKDYHLDHIIPMVAFDFDNPNHVYLCYHKENLRWLEPSENSSKKDKIVWSLYEGNIFLLAVAEVLGITKEMDGEIARAFVKKDNV